MKIKYLMLALTVSFVFNNKIFADQPFAMETFTKKILHDTLPINRESFYIRYSTKKLDVGIEKTWNTASKTLDHSALHYSPGESFLKQTTNPRLPNSMHEDDYASDVSFLGGPLSGKYTAELWNLPFGYYYYPGMTPAFSFINPNLAVRVMFGAKNNLLFLYDPNTLRTLDSTTFVGRQKKFRNLRKLENQYRLFTSTAGGAYFCVNKYNQVVIPVTEYYPNDTVEETGFWFYKVDTFDNRFSYLSKYNIYEHEENDTNPENKKRGLIAVVPDSRGNYWGTTNLGEVFVFDPYKDSEFHYIRLNELAGNNKFQKEVYSRLINLDYEHLDHYTNSGDAWREYLYQCHTRDPNIFDVIKPSFEHKIQNSFITVGEYAIIITNQVILKLSYKNGVIYSHWNDTINNDPEMQHDHPFYGLYYNNSGIKLPGHVQASSGTTPTLLKDERGNMQVLFCDNDFPQIKLKAVDFESGRFLDNNDLKLFTPYASACENSVIAYNGTAYISNTFGYVYPYDDLCNQSGGIEKFVFKDNKWQRDPQWAAATSRTYDTKTATPKLSLADGKLYIYNTGNNKHMDGPWGIAALDASTGEELYRLVPKIKKQASINNLWGTLTIMPGNAILVATKMGFMKIHNQGNIMKE